MSLLVRKITLNKWMQTDILSGASPSADAITGCTRTRDNALSVWGIDTEEELEDAILAIASVGDHLDKIDIVLLDRNSVEDSGLLVQQVPGNTPYRDFVHKHYDLYRLDYNSLGIVAQEIICSIRTEGRRTFTRGKLKKIVAEGIRSGKVSWQDLSEAIRKHIHLS